MAYDVVPPPLMSRPHYVPELLQMQTRMRSRTHAPDSWYQLFRGCKAIILFIVLLFRTMSVRSITTPG